MAHRDRFIKPHLVKGPLEEAKLGCWRRVRQSQNHSTSHGGPTGIRIHDTDTVYWTFAIKRTDPATNTIYIVVFSSDTNYSVFKVLVPVDTFRIPIISDGWLILDYPQIDPLSGPTRQFGEHDMNMKPVRSGIPESNRIIAVCPPDITSVNRYTGHISFMPGPSYIGIQAGLIWENVIRCGDEVFALGNSVYDKTEPQFLPIQDATHDIGKSEALIASISQAAVTEEFERLHTAHVDHRMRQRKKELAIVQRVIESFEQGCRLKTNEWLRMALDSTSTEFAESLEDSLYGNDRHAHQTNDAFKAHFAHWIMDQVKTDPILHPLFTEVAQLYARQYNAQSIIKLDFVKSPCPTSESAEPKIFPTFKKYNTRFFERVKSIMQSHDAKIRVAQTNAHEFCQKTKMHGAKSLIDIAMAQQTVLSQVDEISQQMEDIARQQEDIARQQEALDRQKEALARQKETLLPQISW